MVAQVVVLNGVEHVCKRRMCDYELQVCKSEKKDVVEGRIMKRYCCDREEGSDRVRERYGGRKNV